MLSQKQDKNDFSWTVFIKTINIKIKILTLYLGVYLQDHQILQEKLQYHKKKSPEYYLVKAKNFNWIT